MGSKSSEGATGGAQGETARRIGLLLVHGIGEQKPFEHLKTSAKEIASNIAATNGLIRLSVIEDLETARSIRVEAVIESGGGAPRHHVRIDLKEVYWADLGIKGGLIEQVKFWFWGLGQWAAHAVRKGNPGRNTARLMAMPAFTYQKDPMEQPGLIRQLPARFVLFAAGLLAFLTFFSWSVAKRFIAFLAQRIPDSSLIFLFLGDVKNYEQSGGAGKGTLADPNQPMRTTIRRRMIGEMIAMAGGDYHEWYLFSHSLGTVPAFNAIQETELALPNYLTAAEWAALPSRLKTRTPFIPPATAHDPPTTDAMMPRRPPWLNDRDGVDRKRLFERFRGLVTYGSPLDKFAAMWPRVVCLNLQAAVFRPDCEWINLHEPTDPVSARLDAFAPPKTRADEDGPSHNALAPKNFATDAGLIFGLSHIRYFLPRRKPDGTMPAEVLGAIVAGTPLSEAAGRAKLHPVMAWLHAFAATVQVVLLALALAAASAALLIVLGKALPDTATSWLGETIAWLSPALAEMLRGGLRSQLLASAIVMLAAGGAATLFAGVARFLADAFKPGRR